MTRQDRVVSRDIRGKGHRRKPGQTSGNHISVMKCSPNITSQWSFPGLEVRAGQLRSACLENCVNLVCRKNHHSHTFKHTVEATTNGNKTWIKHCSYAVLLYNLFQTHTLFYFSSSCPIDTGWACLSMLLWCLWCVVCWIVVCLCYCDFAFAVMLHYLPKMNFPPRTNKVYLTLRFFYMSAVLFILFYSALWDYVTSSQKENLSCNC